jgi:hypothetical protein
MEAPEKPGVADIDEDPNVELRPYSSPPCYAHEVDPAYFGFAESSGPARLPALRRALRDAEAAIAAFGRGGKRLAATDDD